MNGVRQNLVCSIIFFGVIFILLVIFLVSSYIIWTKATVLMPNFEAHNFAIFSPAELPRVF